MTLYLFYSNCISLTFKVTNNVHVYLHLDFKASLQFKSQDAFWLQKLHGWLVYECDNNLIVLQYVFFIFRNKLIVSCLKPNKECLI